MTPEDEALIRQTFPSDSWPIPALLAEIDRLRTQDLVKRIEDEIHHAEDNGFVITEGQGVGPAERIPAVPIRYLRAVLAPRPMERSLGR